MYFNLLNSTVDNVIFHINYMSLNVKVLLTITQKSCKAQELNEVLS